MDALDDALRVIRSFNEAGVDYVVVGGVALNVHGLVRATEDLDVFVRPEVENIARLRQALKAVWSDPDIDGITAADLCGDYPAVRYGPPEGTLYLDILTRLGEMTKFADLEAEEKEIAGVRIRVATPRALYRMKKNTVRAIDRSDALALRRAFQFDEEDGP
ncbi:MAG TPA: nucleotidyl transferase AbiEii/AbiGii toxin family protein [Polyangiales bacterium]